MLLNEQLVVVVARNHSEANNPFACHRFVPLIDQR
jgi:hypothetical protein